VAHLAHNYNFGHEADSMLLEVVERFSSWVV